MIWLKRMIGIFMPLVIVFSCFGSLTAANIYVDNNLSADCTGGKYSVQNRNCSGADGNAYRSIQSAINAMAGGDSIYLRGGRYYERDIYIPSTKSGNSTTWSSMQSYPGEWAIIDGQRACSGSNVHAVIRNGGFAHQGSEIFAKYWRFERLEITGGGLAGASVAPAAGIWWNKGPVTVRYCYIHDNLADNADENPAGFNGCSQSNVTIEYNYFKNNGSINHEHGNSRAICMTSSTEYSSTPYDESWYVWKNVIQYNLIDTNGAVGIATKASQRLTAYRDGSDNTNSAYGDKIHHNIVRGSNLVGIFWQQDYVQVYNNIIEMGPNAGEENWGIATRRIRTTNVDMLKPVIYNNTLIDTHAGAIFDGYQAQGGSAPYWWVYNNIIENHTDDWARRAISYATELPSVSTSNIFVDRNYIYKGTYAGNVFRAGYQNDYTASRFNSSFTPRTMFANSYNAADPLHTGTTGADKYKTRGSHVLSGTSTIATSGKGGSHPYLSGMVIPGYVGATNPDNSEWVNGVLSLASTSVLMTGMVDNGGDTQLAPPQNLTIK